MSIGRMPVAIVGLIFLVAAMPLAASAESPSKWTALDKAVGKEDYAEAKKLADAILQRGPAEDRQKTIAVYGRILLGLGQKDQARQYLLMASRSGGDGPQLAIYRAWLQALDNRDEGMRTLEKMLAQAGESPDASAAETADVLAMLYMAAGDKDRAKKAVDFGLQVLKYHDVKEGHVLALLRGRLRSDATASEAERLYHEAEKLRAAEKFVEAGQLFTRVRGMRPPSEWSHASGFRIGQCYLGLKRPAQALEWWQGFVKESPTGPWRGQARAALVDLALEYRLDLKAATEHALAAAAVLDKELDAESASSWKAAAHDIYLRQGIVSLVANRYDAALQGFEQAKLNLPSPSGKKAGHDLPSPSGRGAGGEGVGPGLDRLIEAARDHLKLLPDELTAGDDRATTALVLGSIYSLLQQPEVAKGWFSLPLNGASRSRSPAHRSFAGFGLARGLIAAGQPSKSASPRPLGEGQGVRDVLFQARALYEASLREYPKGSWHDETLRDLALLVEQAANESRQSPVASGQKAANLSDAVGQQQRKPLSAARAAALPYWISLTARYPASRHAPQALYHAGVLYTETEKPDEAAAAFEQLTQKHPDSPWTGDAHVRLIDVKLEHQFDLPGARKHAAAAVDWYEKHGADNSPRPLAEEGPGVRADGSPRPLGEGPGVRVFSTPFAADALPSLLETGYAIYLRAGLVEYLSEHADRAVAFFEKAAPLQPERNFVVVSGHIPTGIERLIDAAKSGKSLTPEVVRNGDEKAKLILMLADVYHEGEQWQEALDLCTRLLTIAVPRATRDQKSYAHYRRAWAYYRLEAKGFDPDVAFSEYAAAVRTSPKAPWADKAMFRAANIQWNHKHNADAAVTLWDRLCRDYPDSEEVERSTYYVGVAYEWSGRPEEALRAYQRVLERWPNSLFADVTREHMKRLDATIPATTRGKRTK